MIIGVIGPKQSGKSTLTKILVERYGFTRTAFADPLKRALMVAFDLTRAQVSGDEKEIPTDNLCGETPRTAMETLGTNWGRQMIHQDIWLSAWRNTLPGGNLVIEDVRFPNECQAVKETPEGCIISVRRPGREYDPSIESEAHADLPFDFKIRNDASMSSFESEIEEVLAGYIGLLPK